MRLLVVLAAAAGRVDVLCVTAFGGPFASVVAGNLVQLGRSIATADGQLAAECGDSGRLLCRRPAIGTHGHDRADPTRHRGPGYYRRKLDEAKPSDDVSSPSYVA
ncbi:MAG TPA: hypothetical protein VNP20_19245 [Nocardioidaceae bacterium]|nr:hypothetical protein [Nocardioidaceae bacterium]